MAELEEQNGVADLKNELENEVAECEKEKKLRSDENMPTAQESENENNIEEETVENKLACCKELYNCGSRNFLLKNYQLAADELGEACELFEEMYGAESEELGMPLLLYAKSLIALSLDENKILDVPEVEEDDDSDEQPESENENILPKPNGSNKTEIAEASTSLTEKKDKPTTSSEKRNDTAASSSSKIENTDEAENEDEEDADATYLQVAWETLELSAKIFAKQGLNGLPKLAEIHTELANIQFENEIFEAARDDYGKALKIYQELPVKEYRRAQAEIHYKIGLTFLLQTMNKEGAESFKTACDLLSDEVNEMKNKKELTESDKNVIKDIEETQQDIMLKIAEIEETRQQVIEEVRAALDKFKSPSKQNIEKGEPSSSTNSSAISKPNDITHLIKRKKPDTPTTEIEGSPAKRLNSEKTA